MNWSLRIVALAAVGNALFLESNFLEARSVVAKKAVAAEELSGAKVERKNAVELNTTTQLLWPRLVEDVKRTRVKLARLHSRIATLNARMDGVLNRTNTTQPLVLKFYDQAILTGTSAAENNITIHTIQPKILASTEPFGKDQVIIAEDLQKLAASNVSLPSLPELVAEHEKLIKMNVKLDEVTPAIDKFQSIAIPIEDYLKTPYETLIKRSLNEGMNNMMGDLTTVMGSHLAQAEKDTDAAA